MQNTANFKMNKPDYNNVADIGAINANFDVIDSGITPFYVATLNSTNTYKITTGLSIIALQDGFSVRVAIPSASTGAVSLIVDAVSAIAIKKVNGKAVTNLKSNGVYSLTYYNSVFILASGADDSDSTSVGTDGSNVKTGITFVGTDGEVHTGTFTADGTITAGDVLKDKIGYSQGNKIVGTMANNGAKTASLNCGGSYTIPQGYHNGSGKVTANSLASQTSGTATKADIVSGKTAWVNGIKLTGTANTSKNIVSQSSYKSITTTEFYTAKGTTITLGTFIPSGVFFIFGGIGTGGTCWGKPSLKNLKSLSLDTEYNYNMACSEAYAEYDSGSSHNTYQIKLHYKITKSGTDYLLNVYSDVTYLRSVYDKDTQTSSWETTDTNYGLNSNSLMIFI
ncbi:MAG: hypothetical protein E7208_03620 [Clostridium butyricum]|nr:hypothetical protein [Clostridium butyricum]